MILDGLDQNDKSITGHGEWRDTDPTKKSLKRQLHKRSTIPADTANLIKDKVMSKPPHRPGPQESSSTACIKGRGDHI